MSNHDLSFIVITWNMGKSLKKITDWNTELQKWTLVDPKIDIICIGIQETNRTCGSQLLPQALQAKLPDHYIITAGEGSMLPGINFHVYGYVCIRRSVTDAEIAISKSICINKYMMCTKPSVGIGINIGCKSLLFIVSHLPINVKDHETLGFAERIDAIEKINKELIQPLSTKMGTQKPLVFWAGDMNFRIQDNLEQLKCFMTACGDGLHKDFGCDSLISQKLLNKCTHIKDFTESPRDPKYNKSCRYVEYDNKTARLDLGGISRPGKTDDKDIFTDIRISDLEEKYDPKRTPSYCDRILYTSDRGIKIDTYSSWPPRDEWLGEYPLSILYSDHEPIYMSGTILCNKVW